MDFCLAAKGMGMSSSIQLCTVCFFIDFSAFALWAFGLRIQAYLSAIFSNAWSDDFDCQTFFREGIAYTPWRQWPISRLLLCFHAALWAFLDALSLHLLGCHIQMKFDLQCFLFSHGDMAPLLVIWNMLVKVVISMQMSNKSKWFWPFECLFTSFPYPNIFIMALNMKKTFSGVAEFIYL